MSQFTETMEMLYVNPAEMPNAPTDEEILAGIREANPKMSTPESLSAGERQGFLEMWHMQQFGDHVRSLDNDGLAEVVDRANFSADLNKGHRAMKGMRTVATIARAEQAYRQNRSNSNGGHGA